MATITEDYVSFELAKLLKEKGFDEPCHCFYEYRKRLYNDMDKYFPDGMKNSDHDKEGNKGISAPTHQMAMAWLRAKYIIIVVQPEYFNVDGICSYWGVDIWKGDNYVKLQGDYPSYEKAVETALKYCLENLI